MGNLKLHFWGCCLFYILVCFSCKPSIDSGEKPNESHLGVLDIEVSCHEAALPAFKEGLLLLHSFQFADAAEKFQEARVIDTTCAMAYWGEAMSENHPLWREQDKDEALFILSKLGDNKQLQREKFITEFEKDMFDAICILYGNGTKKENDQAYADFMETLHDKYPENHEVRAFYALSLLGAIEDDRKESLYGKGAQIAQSIIDENPHHPGALHYLIHSYDDPENAHKALHAADSYAKVAPDAAHALHMPSHIYVALGKWDEVIKSNEAAVAASIERKERKDLELKAIDFHSLKWLMYGHLQKAEYHKARELVLEMEAYCEAEQSPKSLAHNTAMKALYFTETNQWNDDSLFYDTADYSGLSVQLFGTRSFMLGMKAFENKNGDSLAQIIASMEEPIIKASKDALMASDAMCSGSFNRSRPTINHVKRTQVVQLQLKALLAKLNHDNESVGILLSDAIALEESTTYSYGPPEIVKPSLELYAEWLIEQGDLKKAVTEYEKVLERAPGRYIVLEAIKTLKSAG